MRYTPLHGYTIACAHVRCKKRAQTLSWKQQSSCFKITDGGLRCFLLRQISLCYTITLVRSHNLNPLLLMSSLSDQAVQVRTSKVYLLSAKVNNCSYFLSHRGIEPASKS